MNVFRPRLFTALLAVLLLTSALPAHAFLMWKAEKEDAVIHVLAKVEFTGEGADIDPAVAAALDQSSAVMFVFQLDPDQRREERQRIAFAAMYSKSDSLMRHIPRDLIDAFNATCEKLGIDGTPLVRVKPWAAAYNIERRATRRAGGGDLDHLDNQLFGMAAAAGKAPDYLSNADEVIALFNSLAEPVQVDMLAKVLREAADRKNSVQARSEVWLTGDAARAAELVETSYAPFPALREALIIEQNRAWAGKLTGMTRFDDAILAVVPLDNAVGKGSLLEQLESAGFTVTQVK